jgi:two-component system, NtrC family, nitrogen regulation sensor histidine kinase NtrY
MAGLVADRAGHPLSKGSTAPMTTVEEVAIAEAAVSAPAPKSATGILGPISVVLAVLSAVGTFAILTNMTPISPTDLVVRSVLLADAACMLILLYVISREVGQIVQARRRGRAGSRLHIRIVGLFSVIAAVPAILLAVVASITLDRGLDHYFNTRTRALIQNSLTVAEAYLREHAALIRSDIVAMAFDVGRARQLFDQDRDRFRQFLNAQASIRGLPNALIIKGDLSIIERSDLNLAHDFVAPSSAVLAQVSDSEPQIALLGESKTVAAVIKLRGYDDAYLYVARPVDPRVVDQLQATQEGVAEFASLQERRLGVQIAFALEFAVIALIVLLAATWIGLNFAKGLVTPIRRLIGAAHLVSTGNLHVQVPIQRGEGDLAQLGETFNKMTQELKTQRDDLMRAHDMIDSRRRFTEAVLAGASAGVIGVDASARISILNRSAEKLIGRSEADALGHPLTDVVPELAALFGEARSDIHRLVQGQVTINRGGRERNLSVRVTTEQSTEAEHGYVITLDDITDLVLAQRTSAWADIARRIAHEIKNPLTPIQLSAERLRRKYGNVIKDDRGVFEQCTATIVRQVDDIKRMVDEFSRFARMPKPVIVVEDMADVVRQVVFLMRVGHPDIEIEAECSEDPMPAHIDRRLISQALTNIIKNASEAIAAVPPGEIDRGRIRIAVTREGSDIIVDAVDNGIGLPKENRNRLLEPYVTTREKGTGLGLAIVGRILEEHGGGIELNDPPDQTRGAWARLRFSAGTAVSEPVPEQRKVASDR